MPYTPENNPYIPGDPYSYDLKWIVSQLKAHDGSIESIQEDISDIKQFIEDIQAAQISGDPWNLRGKNLIFFGDSITYGYNGDGNNGQVTYPYPKVISMLTGADVWNKAVSGATMARKAANVNDLKQQLEDASSLLPTADFIFMAFGINDYIQAIPIGSETYVSDQETWETFNGAMMAAYDYIRNFNSKAQIIFISPWANQYYYRNVNNAYGANIRTYIEAVKSFARAYSCKVIIPTESSGIDIGNWEALTVDNTHYTQLGYTLAGMTVLNNLGGNDPDPDYHKNVFEPLSVPNWNELGTYNVVDNSVETQQLSYNDFTFNPGLYRFEFDVVADIDDYSVQDGYVGIHIRTNSAGLCSPIGIKACTEPRHFVVYKVLNEAQTGLLAFRLANTAGAAVRDLKISSFKICPVTGSIEHSDTTEITSTNCTGSVKFTRKNGRITVDVDLTPTGNIAAFTALIPTQPSIGKLISNETIDRFAPIVIAPTTMSRWGLTSLGTFNVASALTTSNRVLGLITY